ncbi:MAG: ATP synthase F0 subunit C, partial [Nitrospinota bacterium]
IFYLFAPLARGAEEAAATATTKLDYFMWAAISTSFALAIAAIGGATAQGRSIAAAMDGIARNPMAAGDIRTSMIIGLALIESLVIYTLVVVLIILFTDPFGLLK